MLRPPRSTKRFQGSGLDAAGTTNLSSLSAEADGTNLRRRYALYTGVCLLVVAGIIALIATGGEKDKFDAALAAPADAYKLESEAIISAVAIESNVKVFRHQKSGMQVMTMVPKDIWQDATFGISFRTIPDNDHGAARVVEQAVLSGSKNYPVKDPFNQLMRGSLQTFMDSWTEKDRTGFVLASRNKADFRNGIKVYLDALFNPLMVDKEQAWIFRQEAWRLEVARDKDLYLSGNALNEAKAAQMHPQQSMKNYIYKTLFNKHSYSKNEQGELNDIVILTRNEMVDFYERHYHPSNGVAFCYGPQDYVDECMNLMDPVLSEYDYDESIRAATKVGWQELIKINSNLDRIPYPSYQDTIDFRLARAWVLNDQPMDLRSEVAWFLIEELLIGSPASSLSRLVVDLNLGDDVIGSLEYSLQQWVLILGVSGVPTEEKIDDARDAFNNQLIYHAENGFSPNAMNAALNKIDMRLREQSSTDVPQGVKMFQKVLAHWTYDRDPKQALFYSKAFTDLKADIEENGQEFILELLTKNIVDNQHKLTVELFPSTNEATTFARQEQAWLDNLDTFVTKEQGLQILRETGDLKRRQEDDDSPEMLEKLPRLEIADINPNSFEIPTKVDHDIFDSGITMLTQELDFTDGIAYVDFAIDMSNMQFDDVVLLPLFCNLLWQGGTEFQDGVQFQLNMETETGGVSVYPFIEEIIETNSEGSYVVPDGKHLETKIIISTSTLASKGGFTMFNLLKQLMFDSNVQNEMVVNEILKKMIDDMEDDIQSRGHVYTTLRIQSQYGLPGFVNEQWKGITQLLNLRRALALAKDDFATLSRRLILMADAMRRGNRNGMLLSVTGDRQAIKDITGSIQIFVRDTLPVATQLTRFPDFSKEEHPWVQTGTKRMNDEVDAEAANEAFLVPTRVNTVAKGGILFDQGETIHGADMVIMQYLGGYFLYNELRFGLGAAEAWAVLDIDTGSVVYQSDRDPHILETLAVYEKAPSWLWEQVDGLNSLPVEAEGAVIGAIGSMDGTALQPYRAGFISMRQYLKKDSKGSRQLWRDQVLGAKVKDISAMVERLGAWGKPTIAVVTNQKLYDEALEAGLNLTICDTTGYTC